MVAPRFCRRPHAVEPLEGRTLLATAPAGFVVEPVATGLARPTAMEFAPDGRAFVAEQGGALRVIKNGSLLATPFVSLTVDSAGERGLLGVTFDPNYATNHFIYVYHTVPGSPAHNRVTRFTADPVNPDVALAGSGVAILDLNNLSTATNHNGGAIHFGPDGKLYVAVGENANSANSQSFGNRLGKILRINPDGSTPTDNPFFDNVNVLGLNKQIWALGLRNPFTFAFQPGTGKLHINDVGQSTYEEIDVGVAGANYGWPIIEGFRTTQTAPASYRDPLSVYTHPTAGSNPNDVGIAITGGTFYQRPAGAAAPFPDSYTGDYFYADYGTTNAGNWIRSLDATTAASSLFLTGASNIVDLHIGPDGALYYLEQGNGGTLERVRNSMATPTGLDLDTASDTGVSNGDNITRDDTPTISGVATSGTEQNVYVDGTLAVTQTVSGAFSITLSSLADGVHNITVISSSSGGAVQSASSQPLSITVDRTSPTVAASFEFETSQRVHLVFSENVAATLTTNSVILTPGSPMKLVVSSAPGAPTVGDFVPTALLPDGNYQAKFAAGLPAVTDVAGNPVAAGGLPLSFFVLAGDADRDGTVDFDDLVTLAQNYNLTGKTFSEGNFDYSPDGKVDFDDLVILAQNYNSTVSAIAAIIAPPAKALKPRRPTIEGVLS